MGGLLVDLLEFFDEGEQEFAHFVDGIGVAAVERRDGVPDGVGRSLERFGGGGPRGVGIVDGGEIESLDRKVNRVGGAARAREDAQPAVGAVVQPFGGFDPEEEVVFGGTGVHLRRPNGAQQAVRSRRGGGCPPGGAHPVCLVAENGARAGWELRPPAVGDELWLQRQTLAPERPDGEGLRAAGLRVPPHQSDRLGGGRGGSGEGERREGERLRKSRGGRRGKPGRGVDRKASARAVVDAALRLHP